MHSLQSPESIYLRFFAPLPTIPERDLQRFVNVDYHDRVAFVMLIGEEIIGIGRFDRVDADSAEVAFNIADAHQGRGIGSILLEHLAAAARDLGIVAFTAEVLPQNRSMLQVFAAAGYEISREFDDGVVAVRFDIDPTEKSLQVQEAREHRAEALSVRGVLHPKSVVVIGASRKRNSAGNLVLRNITAAGFAGSLSVVHPSAAEVAGIPAVASLSELDSEVDLAIIAVPAESVTSVVRDCANYGVKAVVVISSGFAETGEQGLLLQRDMVTTARSHGMRVVGPNSFGIANTEPAISLNASLAPFLPVAGTLGLFSQSGALGTGLLAAATRQGLGISTFVSAGNRADLSGNDVLQYWEEDPATQTVGLYLESIGNPRKFSRIARRVARVKPVIVIKSDLTGRELPPGHEVRVSSLSGTALDQVLTQAGVIRAASIRQLFDLAQVFSTQPLPAGHRVGVIGNSAALSTLVVQRSRSQGLRVERPPVSLHPEVSATDFSEELAAVYADPEVDSVIVTFAPSAGAGEREIAAVLAETAARSGKTTVACFLGIHGVKDELTAYRRGTDGSRIVRSVPSFMGPEDAVWALSRATNYAAWKRSDQGRYPALSGIDRRKARSIIEAALDEARHSHTDDQAAPDVEGASQHGGMSSVGMSSVGVGSGGDSVVLDRDATVHLLAAYGIETVPFDVTHTVEEALENAERIGYPVALKAESEMLRHRLELGGVRLGITNEAELRSAWTSITGLIDDMGVDATERGIEVQRMAPPGVACVIRAGEDPLLGPMVSFGLAGDASELLEDVSHRVAPLTDVDAAAMVRGLKSSPRLFGYKGSPRLNVAAVEDVLLRLAELVDDFPAVRDVTIRPLSVTTEDAVILSAHVELTDDSSRIDSTRRRMA